VKIGKPRLIDNIIVEGWLWTLRCLKERFIEQQ
jgi:hypothetical protein